jgi:hypothetical protein
LTVYSLTETCKLNDVDSRAWLADLLAKLPDHPAHRIGEMMPWCREPSWLENIELRVKKAIKCENIDQKYSHV